MLFDVHAHLDSKEFDSDRDAVVERAKAAGVNVITSALGPEGIDKTLSMIKRYDNVFASFGLQPTVLSRETIDETIWLVKKNRESIIALGEVGLDYYWVKETDSRRKQQENLLVFLDVAEELRLPVVLHSRDSEKDILKILEIWGGGALLHCFSGTVEDAEKAISLGCIISIPTSIVYSKSKQHLAKALPLESIVLETDAPYLSPKQKTRNEPANVIFSRDLIADIKKVDKEVVEAVTSNTVRDFFDLKPNKSKLV